MNLRQPQMGQSTQDESQGGVSSQGARRKGPQVPQLPPPAGGLFQPLPAPSLDQLLSSTHEQMGEGMDHSQLLQQLLQMGAMPGQEAPDGY